MTIRQYWTRRMEQELGELDEDDKEVLEASINFDIIGEKIERLI